MKVTTLYFSATYTTRRVVEAVAAGLSDEVVGNAFSDGKSLKR